MYCGKCGKKNLDSVKFCAYCGNRLSNDNEEIKTKNNESVKGDNTNSSFNDNCKVSTGCVKDPDLQKGEREYKDYTIYTGSKHKTEKVKTSFTVWFWIVFVYNLLKIMPSTMLAGTTGLTGMLLHRYGYKNYEVLLLILLYANIFCICALLFYKKKMGFYIMLVIAAVSLILRIAQGDGWVYPVFFTAVQIVISYIIFADSKNALE